MSGSEFVAPQMLVNYVHISQDRFLAALLAVRTLSSREGGLRRPFYDLLETLNLEAGTFSAKSTTVW